jgi:hypothetical protein
MLRFAMAEIDFNLLTALEACWRRGRWSGPHGGWA